MEKRKKRALFFILSLITLPLIIFVAQQVQRLLSRAAYQPANIVINTQNIIGPLNRVWTGFAQGGEEPPPMLKETVIKMKEIKPSYIRLDHIFDSYGMVEKTDKGFSYNFTRLDQTVDDILSMGALPFFSLSYMPSQFTASGNLIDLPKEWNWWKDLVRATIEHYSGRGNRNLNNLYYEVWNEPELPQFGSWKISTEKDYRLLYFYAVSGAEEAKNVNSFYIGGPGLGSFYPNWISGILTYVAQNNLRFDFYSWHRYTKKPQEYVSDAQNTRKIIAGFPKYANIPLLLTEWGIESENLPINNTKTAAAFTVFASSKFHRDINLAFLFEIKDGPPPSGGKWGLLTHEKDNPSLSPKPRYQVLTALNKIAGYQVDVKGEGTYISAMAAKDGNNINVILANYDLGNKNSENVPVFFTGLNFSSYILKWTYVLDGNSSSANFPNANGLISKNFPMTANSVLLLELIPSSSQAAVLIPTVTLTPSPTAYQTTSQFVSGSSGNPGDLALSLKNKNSSLVFRSPEFRMEKSGVISFDINPYWIKESKSFIIFEIPFLDKSGKVGKISLTKENLPQGESLMLAFRSENGEILTNTSIESWTTNTWHRIYLGWDENSLFISADNENPLIANGPIEISDGRVLTFYSIDAAIDNLKIVSNGKEILQRTFNEGSLEK